MVRRGAGIRARILVLIRCGAGTELYGLVRADAWLWRGAGWTWAVREFVFRGQLTQRFCADSTGKRRYTWRFVDLVILLFSFIFVLLVFTEKFQKSLFPSELPGIKIILCVNALGVCRQK